MNFHAYTKASEEIDLSFEGLMAELKMDDLSDMMAKMQEDMEAEFMVNELAKLDLKVEDMPTLTEKQRLNVYEAMERLENMGTDLLDESYFNVQAQQKRMDEALALITQKMDERLELIMSSFDS